MNAPVLFDAVLFDLDGTLVATERFWVAAATRGAQRAFAELGLAREIPTADEWLFMVGLPLERAFELVFGDLPPEQRSVVMARCVEEEQAAVRAGGAALMPGALETLTELRANGLRLGIASNCSQRYLDSMLKRLKLSDNVDAARCLESPGICTKADMLADLLRVFATRSAVMVGDRATDAQAAHANALPHVHLASGLAPSGERVDCEARIPSLAHLPELLRGRARWIEGALDQLGLLEPNERGATLGVTGRSASGKTLFARDVVKWLRARGRAASVVSLDAFLRSSATRASAASAHDDDPLAHAWDIEALDAAVLEPRRRGTATRAGSWGTSVARDEVLVLEGLFLADPRLRASLDGLVRLEVSEELSLARSAAREGGEAALARVRRDFLPTQRAFDERFPAASGELCLDAANPLGG